MLEVLLALTLSASLLGVAAHYTYSLPTVQRSYDFALGNSLFDFSSMLYHNYSVSNCAASTNASCVHVILTQLQETFALRYVRLSLGNNASFVGSELSCSRFQQRCYVLPENGTYPVACLLVCD